MRGKEKIDFLKKEKMQIESIRIDYSLFGKAIRIDESSIEKYQVFIFKVLTSGKCIILVCGELEQN